MNHHSEDRGTLGHSNRMKSEVPAVQQEDLSLNPTSGNQGGKMRVGILMAIVFLGIAFCCWVSPWSAVEIGGDEGVEFSKMELLRQRPEFASLVWNDQSWFYSKLFAMIFLKTGFLCWLPRLTTLATVGGLFYCFLRLMPKGTGWRHLLFAWGLFWCWPYIPPLSISAMIEVPAVSLAMIAVAITPLDRTEWRSWRFAYAGIIFAVAVQVKLTALIVIPALALKIMCLCLRDICGFKTAHRREVFEGMKGWWWPPVLGFVAFAILFVLIAEWMPVWDWSQIWGSHVAAGLTQEAQKCRIGVKYFWQSPGTIFAALSGVFVLWRNRRLLEAVFPLAFLGSVTIIHLFHRPWWDYYGIHFAIPLAILGGWGVGELLRIGLGKATSGCSHLSPSYRPEIAMALASVAMLLWAGFDLRRGLDDTFLARRPGTISNNSLINKLKQYRQRVRWAYTAHNIYTTHAGLLVPPELMVLPLNRFWTGQITTLSILETVKRYDCEILMLSKNFELKSAPWNQFVNSGYEKLYSQGNETLFAKKGLRTPMSGEELELPENIGYETFNQPDVK